MSSEIGRAPTAHASRYLQQLAKHWAHDNQVTFDTCQADIALRGNRVELRAEPDALVATLTTGPEGDPARLRQVFEDHIDRFAFREAPLPFEWSAA
ncbi:MAG: DUF2218 domain-containing protein [Qipengyuania sp.]|jgi:uncharacterized protein|nr:DUF2218 domain-containing protein [Qipengyuania sp.]